MNGQKRLLGAVVAVVSFLLLVGLLYLQIIVGNSAVTAGYVAAHNLSAGATVAPGDVKLVQVRQSEVFDFVSTDPTGKTLAHPLSAGDLVRADDLAAGDFDQISLTVTGPGIAAGDNIDIFANVGGNIVLVGRNITVTGGSATSPVVQVPAKDAPLWIAVSQSGAGTTLVAAKAGTYADAGQVNINPETALQELAGEVSGSGSGTIPTNPIPTSSSTSSSPSSSSGSSPTQSAKASPAPTRTP